MAKLNAFQRGLLERPQPPTAFDVMEEFGKRLREIGGSVYPPGVVTAVGLIMDEVLRDAKHVKAMKAADKAASKTITLETGK